MRHILLLVLLSTAFYSLLAQQPDDVDLLWSNDLTIFSPTFGGFTPIETLPLPDGGLIVVGSHRFTDDERNAFAMRIDPNGNKVWEYTPGGGAGHDDRFTDVILHSNGDLYLTGDRAYDQFYNNNSLAAGIIVRLNLTTGSQIDLEVTELVNGSEQATTLAEGINGQLVIGGAFRAQQATSDVGYLARYSSSLNPFTNSLISTDLGNRVLNILSDSDNEFFIIHQAAIAVGQNCSEILAQDIGVSRRNSQLQVLGSVNIGGNTDDQYIDACLIEGTNKLGVLGQTLCTATSGITGPFNVAIGEDGELDRYWIAEVDMDDFTLNPHTIEGYIDLTFGVNYNYPRSIVASNCNDRSFSVLQYIFVGAPVVGGPMEHRIHNYDYGIPGGESPNTIFTRDNFGGDFNLLDRNEDGNYFCVGAKGDGNLIDNILVVEKTTSDNCTDFESCICGPDPFVNYLGFYCEDFTGVPFQTVVNYDDEAWATFPGTVASLATVENSTQTQSTVLALSRTGTNQFGDVLLDISNYGERNRMEWDLYIPTGASMSYGLINSFNSSSPAQSDWAYYVEFLENGAGQIRFGQNPNGPVIYNFTYPKNQLFHVSQVVDLFNDEVNLFIYDASGVAAFGFHFPLSSGDASPSNLILDRFNFWARTSGTTGAQSDVLLDNFCFRRYDAEIQVNCVPEIDLVCLIGDLDRSFDNLCYAQTSGFVPAEVQECPPICHDPVFVQNCNNSTYFYSDFDDQLLITANDYDGVNEWYINGGPASQSGLSLSGAFTTQLTLNTSNYPGGEYEICYPFADFEGCIDYCCRTFCINDVSPTQPTISVDYQSSSVGWELNVSGNLNQASWYYDSSSGQQIFAGNGNTITVPIPIDCEVRTYYCRFFDLSSGCWRTVFETIYFCDPFDCGLIDVQYDSNLGYELNLLSSLGPTNIQWQDDQTGLIIPGNGTTIIVPVGPICQFRDISVRYQDQNGLWVICCIRYWSCDPNDCGNLTAQFSGDDNGYQLNLVNAAGATDIQWQDDQTGEILPGNGTTIIVPIDPFCQFRDISVRYRDQAGVWRVCCIRYWSCDPFDCGNLTAQFSGNNNGYQLDLANAAGATDIQWQDDQTGQIIPGNGTTIIIPIDPFCQFRDISVRYRDQAGVWRVCCIRYWSCDPFDCGNLTAQFSGNNNGYQLDLANAAGATDIQWQDDQSGEILPGNGTTIIVPIDPFCQFRDISVRYRDQAGVWRVCCIRYWSCDPFDCGNLTAQFSGNNNGYQLDLANAAGATDIQWQDDQTGEMLPGNGTTIIVPIDPFCQFRDISVRYRDQAGVWRVCCIRYWSCDPFDCGNLTAQFSGDNNGYQLDLANAAGATDIQWQDDQTGEMLPGNGTTIIVPIDPFCQFRDISVRYRDQAGVWRVCCIRYWSCDPFDCGNLTAQFSGNNNGYQLDLANAAGATDIQWQDDQTGEILPGNGTTIIVPIDPFCQFRDISVRYRDQAGVWRVCCIRYWSCDPFDCGNLNAIYDEPSDGFVVTLNGVPGANDISWFDDESGQAIPGSSTSIVLPYSGVCEQRFISVRYRDQDGNYFVCCISFLLCPPCPSPVPQFTFVLDGNEITVTNTSQEADSYSWSFGVANSTLENPPPVLLPPGTSIICLTAYNSCDTTQYCTTIDLPDPAIDLIFDLEDGICGGPGEIIDLPLRVRNFNDVLTFQMSLELENPDFATIVGYDLSDLPVGVVFPGVDIVSGSAASISWSGAQGLSLPDESIFITFRLAINSTTSGSSAVHLNESVIPVQAYYDDLTLADPILLSGEASVCSFVTLSGNLLKENGIPLASTSVILNQNGVFSQSTSTDSNGDYTFFDLDAGHDYTIWPYNDDFYTNGVDAGDVFRLQNHVLLANLLDSPYKAIAGDVHQPLDIFSIDVSLVRQLILGDIQVFTDVNSWRFVPSDHAFDDPAEPTATAFPESVTFTNLQSSNLDVDFIGMKMGDVNLNAVTSPLPGDNQAPETIDDDLTFAISAPTAYPGETYTVEVTTLGFTEMIAAQFSMSWDSSVLMFTGLSDLNSDLNISQTNFSFASVENGRLPFAWWANVMPASVADSTLLFKIDFEILGLPGDSLNIQFGENPTPFYFESIDETLTAQFEGWQATVQESPSSRREYEANTTWKIFPNPVNGNFQLNASTNNQSTTPDRVQLFGVNGRLLKSWNSPGSSTQFNVSDLPTGVYSVRITDEKGSQLSKIVIQ